MFNFFGFLKLFTLHIPVYTKTAYDLRSMHDHTNTKYEPSILQYDLIFLFIIQK